MKYLILIALLFGLIGYGGQGVYSYLRNPKPVELGCDEFLKARPDHLWFSLKGCALNLAEALYEYNEGTSGKALKLFVPIRPSTDEGAGKTPLILQTDDPKLMGSYQKIIKLGDNVSDEQAQQFMIEHAQELFVTRDVQGMIQFGLDLSDSQRDKIAGLADDLTKDFVILEEGKKPNAILSLVFLLAGVGLLGLAIRKFIQWRGQRGAVSTPAPAAPGGGGFVPPPPEVKS